VSRRGRNHGMLLERGVARSAGTSSLRAPIRARALRWCKPRSYCNVWWSALRGKVMHSWERRRCI